MQKRLPKTSRAPGGAGKWLITDRTLEVLKVIASYRFIPTSLILALTPGNDRVTQLHLQRLFHDGLVNRFPIRRGGRIGQFVYYLDELKTLRLLEELAGDPVTDAGPQQPGARLRGRHQSRRFSVHRPRAHDLPLPRHGGAGLPPLGWRSGTCLLAAGRSPVLPGDSCV